MQKIKVAMFSDEIDVDKERCPYYRRLIAELLKDPSIELTLIHSKPNPREPLYRQAREIVLPRWNLPVASRFVAFLRFCLTTKERWDVVHWLHARVFPFFWLFPAKKKVVMAHSGGDVLTPSNIWSWSRFVFNWTIILFNRHVDALLAVSNFANREIVHAYKVPPQKVFTVFPALDQMYEPLPDDATMRTNVAKYGLESGNYILFIGRFRLHKHVGHLVRSYIRYREQHPEAKEVLALAGSSKNEYVRTFGELPASPFTADIKFIGYVEPSDIPSLYRGAMVVSFVTLSEGFGMPMLEAWACKTPVITSNMTATPEVAGNAAIVVEAYSPQALADAFALVRKPDVRKTLVERGYKRSRFFTIEMAAKGTTDVYRTLLFGDEKLRYDKKPLMPIALPYDMWQR